MNTIQKSKVSTKGQITIPKHFREKLKVNVGDEVTLVMMDDAILVKPKISRIGVLRGILKEEIDINKAAAFIEAERKKWRL
jgi:AbrB family looped-hinge helix DNA binding protein